MSLMSLNEFRNYKYVMSSNKKGVGNQHYVSRGIQRFFSEKGNSMVGCFNRNFKYSEDLRELKELSVKSIMTLKNGYEIYNSVPNLLEQYFKYYEDMFIPLLRQLINLIETDYSYKSFKNLVVENLEIFLLFYYRAGYTMEYFASQIDDETGDSVLDYTVIKDRIENVLGDVNRIKLLSDSILKIYGNPILLVSDKCDFLLSDTYFSLWSNKCYSFRYSNREIGFYDTNILIPLSSKYYILFSNDIRWQDKKKIKIYDRDIKMFNSIIFRNSVKYCVGKLEILKSVISKLPNTDIVSFKVQGVLLNKGCSKGNIFEDYLKDDLIYLRSINYKYDSPRLVKNTYIEFFQNIITCDSVYTFIQNEVNGNLAYVFSAGRSKYFKVNE